MVDKPPIQRVDDALAQYYKQFGRNDYFDVETGMGKFRQFVRENEFENDHVDEDLADDVSPDECLFIDIDPMFPLPMCPDESRDDEICKILKHCYKYGVAPPLTLLQEESLIGGWQRIA
eukprot:712728_1